MGTAPPARFMFLRSSLGTRHPRGQSVGGIGGRAIQSCTPHVAARELKTQGRPLAVELGWRNACRLGVCLEGRGAAWERELRRERFSERAPLHVAMLLLMNLSPKRTLFIPSISSDPASAFKT